MTQRLALFIGRRFRQVKRRNRLVSFISISSVLGISVGVMALIIGLSAMNGFERELRQRVLSVIPQGQLTGVGTTIENWPALAQQARRHPQVVATAPYVEFTGLLEKGVNLKPAQIRAVSLEHESQVSDIYRYVTDNAWPQLVPGTQRIIIGQGIADALEVKTGDWLTLLIPMASDEYDKKLRAPKKVRLQVAGTIALGGQIDHGLALIALEDGQNYFDLGSQVSGISLKFQDPFTAPLVMREVGGMVKQLVAMKNWMHQYGYLYRDIKLVRAVMYLVMVLVIGVACFNIVSTLMMAVKERATDIAILQTMGAKNSLIRSIFVWHGLMSGVIGSAAGCLLGASAALYLTHIVEWLEKLLGKKFLSSDIYFVNFLPTELHLTDLALVSFTAIALSLFATWYPTRRACQLQPARVLSGK
ncbi:MAG: lipoprotein-releasing ABC transporter permease subunit LolE [Enterovibrio sp.]